MQSGESRLRHQCSVAFQGRIERPVPLLFLDGSQLGNLCSSRQRDARRRYENAKTHYVKAHRATLRSRIAYRGIDRREDNEFIRRSRISSRRKFILAYAICARRFPAKDQSRDDVAAMDAAFQKLVYVRYYGDGTTRRRWQRQQCLLASRRTASRLKTPAYLYAGELRRQMRMPDMRTDRRRWYRTNVLKVQGSVERCATHNARWSQG